ncbi:MAG: hypothetical protein HYY48_03360 [Gammaproteobacteria bacterium]|nr:hypothetical protein [Gammaproteobacteria bacterium]
MTSAAAGGQDGSDLRIEGDASFLSGLLFLLLFPLTQPCVAADPPVAEDLAAMERSFEYFADARLRGDFVRDLPRPIEKDFERGTIRVRPGISWFPNEVLEFGVAARINLSTQGNSKTRFNLDNEKADDVLLDELFMTAHLSEETELLVGQSQFPLRLSPMLWDQDLRPQGVSLRHRVGIGNFNSFEALGGAFLGNHLYGDDSKIQAAQAALRIGEGKSIQYLLLLSWVDFDDLDELARKGLGRTNLLNPDGTFADDFNIADLQLGVEFTARNWPVRARIDLARNTAAGEDGFGGRADLVIGNSIRRQGFEFGVAHQRVQRQAVQAAFNDDDWWFRSRMRGTMVWLGYGFSESLRIRLAGFSERLDVAQNRNERGLVDLEWFY